MSEIAFSAGNYESATELNIMLKLSTTDVVNKDGTISKTYGNWATAEGNLVNFKPGKPVYIDEEMLKLDNVRNLIMNGTLKRVW